MPLPLLLIGIGAAALFGGAMTLDARDKVKKAKAEHAKAYKTYKDKYDALRQYESVIQGNLIDLGQARADAMQSVRDAIDFIKRAKLVKPDIIGNSEISVPDLEKLDQAYGNILKTLGGTGASVAGGAGVGALTALGAYGLVGALGTASTGAAIGGLSGAAASSATLAWFGGGALAAGGLGIAGGTAVLSGIVAAPALIAFGIFQDVNANKLQSEVTKKIQELELAKADIERHRAKIQAIQHRIEEVQRTIYQLRDQIEVAVQKANPDVSEDVYRVVQIAKALRAAIDEPVVHEIGGTTAG